MSSYPPVTIPREINLGRRSEPVRKRTGRRPEIEQRHAEVLSALTLQIARGHPREALTVIDGLQGNAWEQNDQRLVSVLHVMRAVAELEAARLEALAAQMSSAEASSQESAIDTILQFVVCVLPALRQAAFAGSNPVLASQLVDELFAGGGELLECPHLPASILSDREHQVLHLVAAGLSNQGIASRLFISEGTVKKHLSNLLAKLGADNRTHAVAHARRMGLV